MRNDDILLNEAYSKIYNEGIWDRLKGQASGVGSGLKQGFQNIASKTASALGANVQPSGETMGSSYANAQQTSLLNSFIKKAQKEIADFNNDISKMGVNPNDQQFPEIKAQLDSVNNLIKFLQNPQGAPPADASQQQPTANPPQQQQQSTPEDQSSSDQNDPNFNANVAGKPPAIIPSQQSQSYSTQTNTGANFNANVAGKSPAIPHGRQTPSGASNQSFTSSPSRPMKNITPYKKQQPPVKKALQAPPEIEAEIVNEPVQSKTGKMKTSTVPTGKTVNASETDLTGGGAMVPRKYTKRQDGWYSQGNMKVGPDKSAKLDKIYQKQSNKPQQSSQKASKAKPTSYPKMKAKPQKNKPQARK
jgi:hypothetical protein